MPRKRKGHTYCATCGRPHDPVARFFLGWGFLLTLATGGLYLLFLVLAHFIGVGQSMGCPTCRHL